jgi:hypothetical protein
MLLDRPRHRRRGLAGADDDQPPAIIRRQVRRHAGAGSAAAMAASNRRRRMSAHSRGHPAEAGFGRRQRLVFAADPAVVTQLVEQPEQERIVDFAGARFVAAGVVGNLDVADAGDVGLDGPRQIALDDLRGRDRAAASRCCGRCHPAGAGLVDMSSQ